MSIEKLIEDARKRRSPAEQLLLDGKHQERIQRLENRLHKEFQASIVTEELLNKRCTL